MTTDETKEAIRKALAEALPGMEAMDWDAALTGDVGLDSVQIMNLVMEIEDNLDISIPVDRLADVQTLSQLAAQVDALRGESGA